jgi:hypothetical protein
VRDAGDQVPVGAAGHTRQSCGRARGVVLSGRLRARGPTEVRAARCSGGRLLGGTGDGDSFRTGAAPRVSASSPPDLSTGMRPRRLPPPATCPWCHLPHPVALPAPTSSPSPARVRRPPTPADPRPWRRHHRVPIRGLTCSDDFPSPTKCCEQSASPPGRSQGVPRRSPPRFRHVLISAASWSRAARDRSCHLTSKRNRSSAVRGKTCTWRWKTV